MQRYTGKIASSGIAVGPVVIWKKESEKIQQRRTAVPQTELERLERAGACARAQLGELCRSAEQKVGSESAAIFEVHQMMLEDEEYLEEIQKIICEEAVNAEYAVYVTGEKFAAVFEQMEDAYLQARAADVKDISARLIRCLQGRGETQQISRPSVVIAEDLSPSETMQMDKEQILAFVTVHGSVNSHTAILARMMNVPALVGTRMDLKQIQDGMTAVVDAKEGFLCLEPDEELQQQTRGRMEEEQGRQRQLQEQKGKESVTADGRRIAVYANISSAEELDYVLENDAEGIGLFRSEFLYLGRADLPTEEEQFQIYRRVLQKMGEKKVVIRTLDIGADKQSESFNLEREENPALGYRGIRICLSRPALFRTQLRALWRAAAYGNLSVLYPMITSAKEVRQIQTLAEEVQNELEQEGVVYCVPEQGIMIETPAAALISDELAAMTDFFSIGTNDLTQYTLAIDRQNARLDDFYDPHHRAVLRLIELVTKEAHAHGKWVGICGELGADLALTEWFLDLGIDELSVAPGQVLPLRRRIREL